MAMPSLYDLNGLIWLRLTHVSRKVLGEIPTTFSETCVSRSHINYDVMFSKCVETHVYIQQKFLFKMRCIRCMRSKH